MNDLTSDLEHVANSHARTLRIILAIGIVVALFNFSYTVVISIRDLMRSDAELNKARQETAKILSTVHEGLFLLDKNKRIGMQFSNALPKILEMDITHGMEFLPILRSIIPKDIYESAVDYIELLLGERVKESLVTSLNPLTNIELTLGDQIIGAGKSRFVSFFFNRVTTVEEKFSHLLVTIQDVTDKAALLQAMERAKNQTKTEVETLLRLVSTDFESLLQFIDNTGRSLAQINEKMSQPQDDVRERLHTLNHIMRIVHGIKGEAAVLGVEVIENYAHDCEKEITAMRESEDQVSSDQILRIAVLLEGFYERHSSLAQIVSRFGEAMGKKPGTEEAGVEDAQRVQQEHPFAGHITTLAQRIAMDHEKQVEVSCQLEKLFSLPEPVVQELQNISVQLVRNALSHGIESPGERARLKKPESGALALLCEYLGNGQYNFTVRDDGCGIVPERLRQNFVKTGRISAKEATTMSNKEIARLIFQPGVSTAETADKDAGHGVGLDVVLEKVKAMGGHLLVKSRPNMFTEFHIRFSIAE
jgi:signal transduction histidine kinase